MRREDHKDDLEARRETREKRRKKNKNGRDWLRAELKKREMTAAELWQRMLHFGMLGYPTVTAYTRGDLPITGQAEVLARALGVDVADVYDAAAGRNRAKLTSGQELRRKAALAGIDEHTSDEVALVLGRFHKELKRLIASGESAAAIVVPAKKRRENGESDVPRENGERRDPSILATDALQ